MKITVGAEPFDSDDARRLIEALDAHLSSRYSPEQRFGPNLKPAHLAPGVGTFVVARADGRAIGCGAVRRLDEETFEVKRMFVEPDLRGHGVAKEILSRLEGDATALGARRLVLETGVHQVAAIGLYRRAGYQQIDCWGEYATSETTSSGFGRVAAWSAGLLVVSGAALALLHFANPLETITTAYGGVLVVKLPLVAAALWLAWRGRRRWELGALAGVLVAAAVLVSLPPPR